MDPSAYAYAKLRYARIRQAVYTVVREDAVVRQITRSPFRLADVDGRALAAWERTWQSPHPNDSGGWNWRLVADEFRSDPAVLKVALWSGSVLCGLAFGRPSHRTKRGTRSILSIHYMEGNPDPAHPLKGSVAALLVTTAEIYGRELGASSIRMVDALPGVIPVYLALGFAVVETRNGVIYCEKEIPR
ncbi:MAG TPA: hypothetical protein VFJ16_27255 [Longimicrobium sp.]|nr:hypothetical protein [Longimicrobium sp.]